MSVILKRSVSALALLLAVAPLADAAVLSLYAFGTSGDNTDADDYSSSDSDTNSTAGNLVRSSGYGTGLTANWTTPTSATTYSGTDWRLSRKSQPTYFETPTSDGDFFNDYARAYTAGTNYLEWTLTPASGYELDLTSFSIDVATANSRFFYYYLSSSVDGYDTVIDAVGGVTSGSGTPSVSLAGSQFQNLESAITFRLWTWGNQSGSSGSAWQLDDLTINGTTELVPEPASLSLLALGAGLLMRRRRA